MADILETMQAVDDGKVGDDGYVFPVCTQESEHVTFYDDYAGKPLDPELVREARAEEMQELQRHEVYVKVPVEKA